MKNKPVRVTRDVPKDHKNNYLGRDAAKGEVFYEFPNAYGSVDDSEGVCLSEKQGKYPFFEFPKDAVEDAA